MGTIQNQRFDAIQDQIQALQATVKYLHERLNALQGGDASPTFDTITCKRWRVVDKDGKGRISAFTHANGDAVVVWYDKDRVPRINAKAEADGHAGVMWRDKAGKPRIIAKTLADGTVIYPTKDGK